MPGRGPRYSEAEARAAIAAARSWSDALRRLGQRPAGGNHATLKKYAATWGISTEHFDWGGVRPPWRPAIPLAEVLVEGSTYSRGRLKRRLFAAGIKRPRCEMCGQGAPNCNATLDMHCGRKNRRVRADRECAYCGEAFSPKSTKQRFCSRSCGVRHNAPALRLVERPPYEHLMVELAASSYLAVGRKYGVSDNAIRKWVRAYEQQRDYHPP